MDRGLIKLLEADEEDGIGLRVSGAVVDAYTERLKGMLGGGRTGAAAVAYGLARAGNGSLKPMLSSAPLQSTLSRATGNPTMSKVIPAAMQITQDQWFMLTPQLQQVYRQQHLYCQQMVQRQAQQRQQQYPEAGAAAAGVGAQRRATSISRGISFGALMPLLQPYLPPNKRLNALFERFKQNEITREDFVRGARVVVGD